MRRLTTFAAATALALGLAACTSSNGEAPPTDTTATVATTAEIPDVVGLPLDEARVALKAVGIPIVTETDIQDHKMILAASNWTVVEQSGDATGVTLGVKKPTETSAPTPTVPSEPAPAAPAPAPAAPAPAAPPAAPAPAPAAPAPAAPPAAAYFKNCTDARAAGVTPLHTGDPGYRSGLDRDGDGIACE